MILQETIPAATPCCGRKVRPFPFYRVATIQVRRTCPACNTAYAVLLKPEQGRLAVFTFCSWMPRGTK